MKIIEKIFDGITVKKVVLAARIMNGLVPESEPLFLKNEKMTPYHWVEVELLDGSGEIIQHGSAIIWDKRFKDNPSRYVDGKEIAVEITLNGPEAGVAQEHLASGRFDIEALGISTSLFADKVVQAESVL